MIEITSRNKIATNYLKGWFVIDLLSIIPFQTFIDLNNKMTTNSRKTQNLKAIAKVARIGRVYKLIRMIRLTKLFKLLKSKNTIVTQFSTKLKIDNGTERLLFLAFFLIFFFHISTCAWILIA